MLEINDERKPQAVPFCVIKCGELFTDEEGDFMMRTEDIANANNKIYNVVNIETGDMYAFQKDDPIIHINRAELTICD